MLVEVVTRLLISRNRAGGFSGGCSKGKVCLAGCGNVLMVGRWDVCLVELCEVLMVGQCKDVMAGCRILWIR